jgi:hypothetical protein
LPLTGATVPIRETLPAITAQQRAGKTIRPKERPNGGNVVDLMEALRRSVSQETVPTKAGKSAKKLRKAAAGLEPNEAHLFYCLYVGRFGNIWRGKLADLFLKVGGHLNNSRNKSGIGRSLSQLE